MSSAGDAGRNTARRRQGWESAQEAHVIATIVLLTHHSELLLSTLPRHAAALAQAATATARAGGEVAELQQAVRALSLRAVAEQLRLRALRALQRAMQRAAPGLLMATCRKGLGALARSADLQAVWLQIAEATHGSGHSAALVRHVHDPAAVPLLVQRLCRAALLSASTPQPQPPPSALLSSLLSLGGWGRAPGAPAPLPPPQTPSGTPAGSMRRSAPPISSRQAAAEEAAAEAAEAAVVVPTLCEAVSQWRPGGQADQSGLEGTYRSTAPFRSRVEAEESARAAVRAAAASASAAARARGEAAARVAEARAAARPAAGGTAAASVELPQPRAAGSGAPLPGWRGVHGGPDAEAVRRRRVDHLVILVHGVGPHDRQKMDRCSGDAQTQTQTKPQPQPQPHPEPDHNPNPTLTRAQLPHP